MESDNDNSKRNFKPKGLKRLTHGAKKGLKGVGDRATQAIFQAIKKLFIAVFLKIWPILAVILVIIVFFAMATYVIDKNSIETFASSVDNHYTSSNVSSETAQQTYEKTGSLVNATDEDLQNISDDYLKELKQKNNALYKALIKEGYVGEHKISSIPYAEGLKISNTYDFILNADKLNFNRIVWKEITRDKVIKDVPLVVDEETKLKYPDNEEDGKEIDHFVNMAIPYLQSYLVPSSIISGLASYSSSNNLGNFAFQIIDKAYSQIQINQYTIQNVSKHQAIIRYIKANLELDLYEKVEEEESTCEDEETGEEVSCTIEVTYKGYDKVKLEDDVKALMDEYYDAIANGTLDSDYYEKEGTLDTSKYYTIKEDSDIVYGIVEAETLKTYMSVDYEQVVYKDEDVENFENANAVSVAGTKEYSTVNSKLPKSREALSNTSGWDYVGTQTLAVELGENVTYKHFWQDKLNAKESVQRGYNTDDIVEFINTGSVVKTVREYEASATPEVVIEEPQEETESEEEASNKWLSSSEKEYYDSLAEEEELNKIDIINSEPEIYKDYLEGDEPFSQYIGFSRRKMNQSYIFLKEYIQNLVTNIDVNSTISEVNKGLVTGMIQGTGGMVWPMPSNTSVSALFGYSNWYEGWHNGIDIWAVDANGTPSAALNLAGTQPVYAAREGTVTIVYDSMSCRDNLTLEECGGGYGNYVRIDHGDGLITTYAHMSPGTIVVEPQEKVEIGTLLGYMGTSGRSNGVHLHFDVRYNNELIDPLQFFNVEPNNFDKPYSEVVSADESYGNGSSNPIRRQITMANPYKVTGSVYQGGGGTGGSDGNFEFSAEIDDLIGGTSSDSTTFNRILTSKSGGLYYTPSVITLNATNSKTVYSAYGNVPASNSGKDAAIYNMSDLEIMSRLIYAEQGTNSEEAGVLVGLTILNNTTVKNTSVAGVATGKYNNGTQYNYNCVKDSVNSAFWGNIPKFAQDLALIACAAKKEGTYVINGIECISVEGFHARSTIDNTTTGYVSAAKLTQQWFNWKRKVIIENQVSGEKYTGFYGW